MPRGRKLRPPAALALDELTTTLVDYRRHRRWTDKNQGEGKKNRFRRQTAKEMGLEVAKIADVMSLHSGLLKGEADTGAAEAGIAAIVQLAEHAYSQLGICGPGQIGPLAARFYELIEGAAREAGLSNHVLFARYLVPALAAMRKPKTRAFGVMLATMKLFWNQEDWPDPDTKRAKDLAGFVWGQLCSGHDIVTGAWLMAHLQLYGFLDFEDVFKRLSSNTQALRLFCQHAQPEMQNRTVHRLIETAAEASRKTRRAILCLAADLILLCELDRKEFPDVARYKAINWMCYTVHRVPWQVSEDYAMGDEELMVLCVEQLFQLGSLDACAALYKRHTCLLDGGLRADVKSSLRSHHAATVAEVDSFCPSRDPALFLPLEERDVVWCDTPELLRAAEAAVRGSSIVGVDLEWSSFGDWLDPQLALLQVAVPGRVFLVDLLPEDLQAAVGSLFQALLGGARPLTLCFSFHHDLRELARSPWASVSAAPLGVCDLEALCGETAGLSALCAKRLQAPLCKTEQRSCWARRPLRAAQRHYAALDAFVLLQLGAAISGTPLADPELMASDLERRLAELRPGKLRQLP